MTQQKQNKFSRRHATWVCHGVIIQYISELEVNKRDE